MPTRNEPIQITEISSKQAFKGFGQEIQFEPHPHPFIDLSHFFRAMAEKLRPMLLDSLIAKKGIVILVAGQVL